jgi:large subunit ribosomal protein L16
MLQPKKTAYRKQQKGRNKGIATNGTMVNFGEYGLKTLDLASITSRQIESARRAITHYIKRGGKVWIRIFPDKPITKKPMEVRMGNGKGGVEYWVALVQPGKVLFELEGVDLATAQKALKLAGAKLPVKTMFVARTVK